MNNIEHMIDRSLQALEAIAIKEGISFNSADARFARAYLGEIIPRHEKKQIIEDILLAESEHTYIQWVDFTLYDSPEYGPYISVNFVFSKKKVTLQFHVAVSLNLYPKREEFAVFLHATSDRLPGPCGAGVWESSLGSESGNVEIRKKFKKNLSG